VHSTIVPDAFSGTWAMAESGVTLYAYTVSFVPTPNDRAYVNFGLFLESDLGPEAGIMEVELQLRNRRLVNTKCLPSGRLDFEQHQVIDLFTSATFHLSIILRPFREQYFCFQLYIIACTMMNSYLCHAYFYNAAARCKVVPRTTH
jgi:hypothetical protein